MTTTVILEIKTNPGTSGDMLALLTDILPDTRSYDGCLGANTFQGQDDADTLIIISSWESKGHFEKYLDWRKESGVFDRFAAMIQGPPSTRFFNLTEA
jgi:quinol monooxygenase YgiN